MYFIFAILIASCSSSCLENPNVGIWLFGEKGFLPPGSVLGGYQGDPSVDLYICRADEKVGKYFEPELACTAETDGREQKYSQYYVLTDIGHVVWVPVFRKQMPCNMIQSGETKIPTYIGRAYKDNFLIPGSIVDGVVSIPYNGISQYDDFEALTAVPKALSVASMKTSYVYNTSAKYLTFKVKSEDEVFVDFGVDNEMNYRLTIGTFGNKISALGHIGKPHTAYEKTLNILESKYLKSFWVRWVSSYTIEFGSEGNLKPLVNFSDYDISSINSIAFSSSSRDSYWQIADLSRNV